MAAWALTFCCVNLAWIFFRAPTFAGAADMLASVFHLLPVTADLPLGAAAIAGMGEEAPRGPRGAEQVFGLLALCLVMVLACPNTQSILHGESPVLKSVDDAGSALKWRRSQPWAFATAVLLLFSLAMLAHPSKFIYFQF